MKDYLKHNAIHEVFQKPQTKLTHPKIHGKLGHYQADLTFLTNIKKQNSNFHILLNVINVNTKYAYSVALKDKQQQTVLDALERIRVQTINDGRPLKVLQTDNGKEFTNNIVQEWMKDNYIASIFCEKEDKKCLGVAERFNRTIKLMIEKYLTSMNSNRWIDALEDFVGNYNSSFHSSIRDFPERLEVFDEVDLIRANIKHNKQMPKFAVRKGDFVRVLNKRGTFEKEGQRFTGKIYVVDDIGLSNVKVVGRENKISFHDILAIPQIAKKWTIGYVRFTSIFTQLIKV